MCLNQTGHSSLEQKIQETMKRKFQILHLTNHRFQVYVIFNLYHVPPKLVSTFLMRVRIEKSVAFMPQHPSCVMKEQ